MKNCHSATAPRSLRLRPLALSLACIGLAPAGAQVVPTGPVVPVNGGTVSVGAPTALGNGGMALGINQSSLRAIINWQSFSIGAKDQVNIQQNLGASSVLLNRVVNSGPRSEIAGLLSAPGRVYVVNPAGVLFGSTAQVNVGGLVASTLDLTGADQAARNASFMAGGRELSLSGPADGLGEVTVEAGAKLTATGVDGRNGVIALVGASVVNRGEINVARGSVGLLAGNEVVVIDPVGDGLTTFRIATTNTADNARVENIVDSKAPEGALSGRITADGGRIVMMASSTNAGATVVNQQGVLQARSLENRNGEIVLGGTGSGGATNVVAVGGTLDVSAGAAGAAGGKISIEGDMLRVQGATLSAGGSANGQVQFTSKADVLVQAAGSDPQVDGTSTVDDQVLAGALNRGGDVTLTSRAGNIGDFGGWGVVFDNKAQVVKTEGGNASLTVNSNRNIEMRAGSAIQSKSGALNVSFNADAEGAAGQDAIALNGQPIPRRGSIVLSNATVESNGGDIRFYGQSDPINGRAVGDVIREFPIDADPTTRRTAGIELNNSTVSTCGVAQASCAGGGSISLRGEGSSWQYTDTGLPGNLLDLDATDGVRLRSSVLRTGAGAIGVQGRSGLNRLVYGVTIGDDSKVESSSGDVAIAGSGRSWVAGDAVGALMGAAEGVQIWSSSVTTGGNVAISGTGADISAAIQDPQFIALASATGGASFHFEGTGIDLSYAPITAGAGKSISLTGTAGSQAFQINADGTVDADFPPASSITLEGGDLIAAGGTISLQGGAGAIDIRASSNDSTPTEPGLLISTASTTGAGGNIDIQARNVMVQGYNSEGFGYTRLDASGVAQGGNINLRAVAADGVPVSGILGIDNNVILAANASAASGNGGSIRAVGDNTLLAYGSFEAKGGAVGGSGGFVETSGGAFDIGAIRVEASGATAGKWLIDPYNVEINSFGGAPSLPGNPYVPLADSVIRDTAISDALNAGTDVTITTGTGGDADQGDIFMNNAQITYTGAGERTFTLEAHRSVRSNAGTTIASYGAGAGPLNVVFTADVNGSSSNGTDGGQVSYSGQIYSNGGDVTMTGAWANNSNLGSSVALSQGVVVDTRGGNQIVSPGVYTGGSDAAAGGNVTLTGRSVAPVSAGTTDAGVLINNARIATSTGNVDIFGSSTLNSGVRLVSNTADNGIHTTTGNVRITGIGSFTPNSAAAPGHGVVIGGNSFAAGNLPMVQTGSGNIEINGLRLASGGPVGGDGVFIGNRALITSTGGGNISVTGESQNAGGAGIRFANEQPITVLIPAGRIEGSGNVVLRASNDGTSDALVLGTGSQVSAAGVLNLRPGGVDLAGPPLAYAATPVDRPGDVITVGGAAATGFAVSATELTRMSAPTMVFGSNAHAADINVISALNFGAGAVTLQNEGGGNITLQAPITAARVGLASAGNITQTAAAPITAGTLLARSTGGSVLLDQAANNVSASTLGGGAAGAFRYQDVDELRVGPVSVVGYDAAGNAPQVVSAGSMAADTVFVRTLSGDLQLGTAVSSTSGTDLVAAARFQNVGGASLGGAPWRVWADTWVGETRGGIAGSGLLPNLYNCAYLGLCGVSVSPGDNHFIYAQRPTATVVIGNASRPAGFNNPLFTWSITGLILGDRGAGFSGAVGTAATRSSLPGAYAINGSFTSAEGYLVNVVPGTLTVGGFPQIPKPDVVRDLPTTWLYDRNIGPPPICFATGPLEGDRASQGNDVLAREWSRVRSRPNLTSCVDTEKRNGCADF